ncbi:phosphoribosylanthranilate isomerase [Flavobacterium sp. Sd200]|uniref:phosphoribosylanthranilate isomerase n=1 Tax=Flavobacterium sp. Sd200 TaxID=2692211 RepID=UPI00136B8143|nr:phosphoribosylanthranilate isomerase [Flavobacterium sp. Sd200]MXN89964.1 phosphoribosylanthranilate isomerase [Flavobacterium sp. Sd200]
MIIKVCGLADNESSRQVAKLDGIHYLGFIFYDKSKRFTNESLETDKQKVGVFVNAPSEYITEQIQKHGLNTVQLHGNENAEFIKQLPKTVQIIKAFGIAAKEDLDAAKLYDGLVDYFLFDTKSNNHGGTGTSFNWQVLDSYKGNTPFLLSGGIGLDSVEKLKKFSHPKLAGYDLNSRFETAPKIKDVNLLVQFLKEMIL